MDTEQTRHSISQAGRYDEIVNAIILGKMQRDARSHSSCTRWVVSKLKKENPVYSAVMNPGTPATVDDDAVAMICV